ncbi:MAG: 16S rRNA (cytidine(1402)-2'-O)-methyltransferase [Leptospiraceae bacterium]|nr:16S rRNA (cytidine(1402)-2'-O)-methyltransferase [Leptospiraceae bacterium]
MKEVGSLYIVGTPIGNLSDMSFRAVEVLKTSELILCESLMASKKLFSHFQITTKAKQLYNSTRMEDLDWLLKMLSQGDSISYISEAGTPGVSDPGGKLVRFVRENGFEIIPIPGASSLTSILSVSGSQVNPTIFLGFPPDKKGKRENFFSPYKDFEGLIVFLESVYRVEDTLLQTRELFPHSEIIIGRELTKIHEEIILWEPSKELPKFTLKGEFVVLINNHRRKIAKELLNLHDNGNNRE